MVTAPLPASQITKVDVDKKCLTVECNGLEPLLQAMIDKECEHEELLDSSTIDNKCLDEQETIKGYVQELVNTACEHEDRLDALEGTITTVPTPYVYNLCISDNWSCTTTECLPIVECGMPVTQPTEEQIIQFLLSRIKSYENVISNQCTQIATLQSQLANIQLTITQIQNTCCNG